MLTTTIATNVLSSALWEIAVKPLYRGAKPVLMLPMRERHRGGEAFRRAADALAAAGASPAVPAEKWRAFFELTEVQVLVQDLFSFTLDPARPSSAEIGAAFNGLWLEFAGDEGLPLDSTDIRAVFEQLEASARAVIDEAIEDDVLAAHEANAVARQRATDARLDVIEQLVRRPSISTTSTYTAFARELGAEVAARYSYIEPPSVLGRERVALDAIFVAPVLGLRGSKGVAEVSLPAFAASVRRRVVLGDPGGGKSTLAARLCHDLGVAGPADSSGAPRLTPFSIELRRYATAGNGKRPPLVDYFAYWANASYQLNVPSDAFEWLLTRGRLLVVFDGLDEILDPAVRKDVRDAIESFCRRYAGTPVLVTARFRGYRVAPLDSAEFDIVELGEFDRERIRTYATHWWTLRMPHDPPDQRREHVDGFLRDSEVAAELRSNPLMLSLLVSLHRGPGSIPNNLPDVYDRCATLLFETWDKQRNIDALLPFAEHVRPALRDLAWWLFTTPQLTAGVTHRLAVEHTTNYLAQRRFGDRDRARAASESFIGFCRGRAWVFSDQGLSRRGEELFAFTHRTFLEFFAAEHLAYRRQSAAELVAELAPKILAEEWDIVALIALQIKARSYVDGADEVVDALLATIGQFDDERVLIGVRFALRLLRAVVPSPRVSREAAARITVLAARETYWGMSAALLAALASVGPEVRDEILAGAVAALRQMLRSEAANHVAIASELIWRCHEVLERVGGADEATLRFWQTVGARVREVDSVEICQTASKHLEVARDAWPTMISTSEMLQHHGLASLFTSDSSSFKRAERVPPIDTMLKGIQTAAYGRNANAAMWDALEPIGLYAAQAPTPWLLSPVSGMVAWVAEIIGDLATGPQDADDPYSAEARFALWVLSAMATDDLQEMTAHHDGAAELQLAALLRALGSSKSTYFRTLGRLITAHVNGRVTSVPATWDLTQEQRAVIADWIEGRSELVARRG